MISSFAWRTNSWLHLPHHQNLRRNSLIFKCATVKSSAKESTNRRGMSELTDSHLCLRGETEIRLKISTNKTMKHFVILEHVKLVLSVLLLIWELQNAKTNDTLELLLVFLEIEDFQWYIFFKCPTFIYIWNVFYAIIMDVVHNILWYIEVKSVNKNL